MFGLFTHTWCRRRWSTSLAGDGAAGSTTKQARQTARHAREKQKHGWEDEYVHVPDGLERVGSNSTSTSTSMKSWLAALRCAPCVCAIANTHGQLKTNENGRTGWTGGVGIGIGIVRVRIKNTNFTSTSTIRGGKTKQTQEYRGGRRGI
jgi:hypothetical protein